MEIFNRISVKEGSFELRTFFYYNNNLIELISVENSDSTDSIHLTMNGSKISNFDFFDINILKDQHQILENLIKENNEIIRKFEHQDGLYPLMFYKENALVSIGFEGNSFSVVFDNTFNIFMGGDCFLDSLKKLEAQLRDFSADEPAKRIIVSDVTIFEEYLLIDNVSCVYFGFIDNQQAENPQEIFRLPLNVFLNLLDSIIRLNTNMRCAIK